MRKIWGFPQKPRSGSWTEFRLCHNTVKLSHREAVIRRIGERAAQLMELESDLPLWEACRLTTKAIIREDLWILGRPSPGYPYSAVAVQFEVLGAVLELRWPLKRGPGFLSSRAASGLLEAFYRKHGAGLDVQRAKIIESLRGCGKEWRLAMQQSEQELATRLRENQND